MAKNKLKPTIKPIITGIHAPKREKKLIALHYHPDAIRANVKDLKEMSEEGEIKNLFQDIEALVNWALDKLPIAKPKKEDESSEEPILQAERSEEVQCKNTK